jgi:hypothetical protein
MKFLSHKVIGWITVLVSTAFFLGDCLSQVLPSSAKIYKVSDTTISIVGFIGVGSAGAFAALVDDKVRVVKISSEGGSTQDAITIAEEIERRRLNVLVDGVCLSSCANYIFVAARQKLTKPGSIVAFHGGHTHKPYRVGESQLSLENKNRMLIREHALYMRKGVSLDLIVYSGQITDGITDSDGKLLLPSVYSLWAPSKAELKRLGIDGVDNFSDFENTKVVARRLSEFSLTYEQIYRGNLHSFVPKVYESGNYEVLTELP